LRLGAHRVDAADQPLVVEVDGIEAGTVVVVPR